MKRINIDDIRVSYKLDDCINDAIKEGYNRKHDKKYKKIVVAAISLILVCAAVNLDFVSASIYKIRNTIGDFAMNHKYTIDDEDKITIGQTIEDKNIKVTLNECYVDGDKLMFTTNFDSRERWDYAQDINPQIYVNDKLLDIFEDDYSEDIIHNDDETVDLLSSISLRSVDINEGLNIVINYNEIGVTNILDMNRRIKGNWKYSFKINKDQIDNGIIEKEINQSIVIENYEMEIKKIRVFPYRIELTTNMVENEGEHINLVHYVIKDDKGNEYMDEHGKGADGIMTLDYMLDTSEIKTITIIPRTDFHNDTPIVNYDKGINVDIK